MYINVYKMNFRHRGSSLFRQASPFANRLFQQGRTLASQASSGLGNVGRILDVGAGYASKVAKHPELTNIQSPQLQRGLSLLGQGSEIARKGASLAHSGSKFLDERTYRGGNEANITDAIQRAKGIKRETSNIFQG